MAKEPLSMLDRWWRTIATGLCFAAFGAGSLLAGLPVFVMIGLTAREPDRRQRLARGAIHYAFRGLVGMMRMLGVIELQVRGAQRLGLGAKLVLPNHPSFIDVVVLISLIKNANCVAKAPLWRNPFTRVPIWSAGYIRNNAGPALIEDCVAAIKRGDNLIIFPEGTRTRTEGRMHLKRGAAHIALRSSCRVTPVLIQVKPSLLAKGAKWYKVPPVRPRIVLEVSREAVMGPFLATGRSESLAARELTQWLQDYYMGRVEKLAST